VLTFGAPDVDFTIARRKFAGTPPLLPATAHLKIAYAGRLGPDMVPALEVLFAALARLQDLPRRFELFFYGTSYAPAGHGLPTATAVAARHGLAALVHEQPARIGYVDSLRIMLETDLALLLGSEDKSYSPSKLYPTLLAGKPILAVAPVQTVLAAKIEELGGAALVTFVPQAGGDPEAIARLADLLRSFIVAPAQFPAPPASLEIVTRQYTAAAVAVGQLEIFNGIISRQRTLTAQPGMAGYSPEESGSTGI
jgi:hypothetical protein